MEKRKRKTGVERELKESNNINKIKKWKKKIKKAIKKEKKCDIKKKVSGKKEKEIWKKEIKTNTWKKESVKEKIIQL